MSKGFNHLSLTDHSERSKTFLTPGVCKRLKSQIAPNLVQWRSAGHLTLSKVAQRVVKIQKPGVERVGSRRLVLSQIGKCRAAICQ